MSDLFGEVPILFWIATASIGVSLLLALFCINLTKKIQEQKSLRRSESTRYGQISEQFLPLVAEYPYDPKQFRFLGSPVDGVQFEENKIVLVEFKSAGSRLSTRQRKIRDLVRDGRVEFQEIRIE
jgi:predicted Holliday junction resolvase-like endonuclease